MNLFIDIKHQEFTNCSKITGTKRSNHDSLFKCLLHNIGDEFHKSFVRFRESGWRRRAFGRINLGRLCTTVNVPPNVFSDWTLKKNYFIYYNRKKGSRSECRNFLGQYHLYSLPFIAISFFYFGALVSALGQHGKRYIGICITNIWIRETSE